MARVTKHVLTPSEKKTVRPGYATEMDEVELINRVAKFDVVKARSLTDLLKAKFVSHLDVAQQLNDILLEKDAVPLPHYNCRGVLTNGLSLNQTLRRGAKTQAIDHFVEKVLNECLDLVTLVTCGFTRTANAQVSFKHRVHPNIIGSFQARIGQRVAAEVDILVAA